MAKQVIGIVLSNKMNKTVVVEIERKVLHPRYKKYVRKQTKLYAHDEKGEAKIGDRVQLFQSRPLSKLKRWRVFKVL
ncbi:MAG: 30S ribosomal protein S17 [Candidatus Latescibacteria bacterium]|nr:30S ribosomal protein S17 [Candidatus Latescibacterota bacterium]